MINSKPFTWLLKGCMIYLCLWGTKFIWLLLPFQKKTKPSTDIKNTQKVTPDWGATTAPHYCSSTWSRGTDDQPLLETMLSLSIYILLDAAILSGTMGCSQLLEHTLFFLNPKLTNTSGSEALMFRGYSWLHSGTTADRAWEHMGCQEQTQVGHMQGKNPTNHTAVQPVFEEFYLQEFFKAWKKLLYAPQSWFSMVLSNMACLRIIPCVSCLQITEGMIYTFLHLCAQHSGLCTFCILIK